MNKLNQFILVTFASMTGSAVFAQKSGDFLLNIGVAHISPKASLQSISSNEPVTNGALQGATVRSSNTNTLSFGASYMLTDNIAAEFALGIPPKLKLDLNVPSGNHPNALNTTVVFPALLANYYFGSGGEKLRPFVGAGISYIRFQDNEHNAGDPVVNGLASQSISIKSTWSPVLKIGASYKISDRWLINGATLLMPVKVNGNIAGPGIGAGPAVTDLSIKLKTKIFITTISYSY